MRLTKSERLRRAVHARGLWTRDLRDAAHEAHHALTCRLRGKWTRDRVEEALKRKFPYYSDRLADELLARAVEQLVCRHFRVREKPVEYWVAAMARECLALDNEDVGPLPSLIEAVKKLMKSKRGRRAANRVLTLLERPAP